MSIVIPKIEKRDFEALFKEFKSLIPFYTPEWRPKEDGKTPDIALVKIFINMLCTIYRRFNRLPEKHLISFLDRIGINLLTAQPASTPITFTLSEGTTAHTLIPAKTQVAAGDVIFETEKNILAAPASLVKLFSTDFKTDSISECSTTLLSPPETSQTSSDYFDPFNSSNLQEHILYLGDTDLFNIKNKADLAVYFLFNAYGKTSALVRIGKWQYYGKSIATGLSGWNDFSLQTFELNRTRLTKTNTDEIEEYEIDGIKSRWLRCVYDPSPALKETDVEAVEIAAVDTQNLELQPDTVFQNDVAMDLTLDDHGLYYLNDLYPFGKKPVTFHTCYIASADAFSKKGKEIILNFSVQQSDIGWVDKPIPLIAIYGIGPVFIERLNAAGITTVNQLLHFTVDQLMEILDTRQRLTVVNIKQSARLIYIEASLELSMGLRSGEGNLPPDPDKEINDNTSDLTLSWEYWDGKTWNILKNLDDWTDRFLKTGTGSICFTCPTDIEKTNVNGKENYWIRVRIIHGDYGKEIVKEIVEGTYELSNENIHPPIIKRLTISYDIPKQKTQYCLTKNNLDYADSSEANKTAASTFKPITMLPDKYRTLYLGFDKKLEKGPINLFFVMDENVESSGRIPRLEWQYYAGSDKWTKPRLVDKTDGLTKTGDIEFTFSSDFQSLSLFGQDLYWLRILDIDDYFKPGNHSLKIKGLYANTVWAIQGETVNDETLGSSTGLPSQTYTLKKTPVLVDTESIWVNEYPTISGEERSELEKSGEYETLSVTDENDKVLEFWVKWTLIDNLVYASSTQRCYTFDYASGQVTFGDGVNGKIPPTGPDNIKADYRSGGGSKGNLSALEIKDMKSSIPFVEKALNPCASAGGMDAGSVETAMDQGPYLLKHRNRGTTAEDMEQLTLLASRSIARVKCIPSRNPEGNFEPGWVTLVVIPQSPDEKPALSIQLRNQIENYLYTRINMVIVNPAQPFLRITPPQYVEVSVSSELALTSPSMLPTVESAFHSTLQTFLNPLTGGNAGTGWEFGKLPRFSDFYALLEKIEGVDHVEDLSIKFSLTPTGALTPTIVTAYNEDEISGFTMPIDGVICNGEHKVDFPL